MAELADAMDLGSIGNTVQVRPLLPAPSIAVCKKRLTDRYFFSFRAFLPRPFLSNFMENCMPYKTTKGLLVL